MEENNPLLQYTEEQRAAYLTILSTLAMVDGEVDEEEAQLIEEMCKDSKLSFAAKMQVLNGLYKPEEVELAPLMETLKNTSLKFSLVADILKLVQSDGEFTPEEVKQVAILKSSMLLSDAQYDAVNKYVEMASSVTSEGITSDFLEKAGLDKKFAELGIPADTFSAGTTIGEVLGKAALGVVSKELEGTELGKALEIGKAVGGVFAGIVKNKNKDKKDKKKKKGFFRKLLGKKVNNLDTPDTETAEV